MTARPPRILIIAGPNGAGKTTFALEYLPNEAACKTFLNADLIAAGLSPFDPDAAAIQAGKLMLAKLEELAAARTDFSFETTLSGKLYARMIPVWRQAGYWVRLAFLQLPSADFAINRVAGRVMGGGHNIPDAVVRRRFDAGLNNFSNLYRPLVSDWRHYDNAVIPRRLLGYGHNET